MSWNGYGARAPRTECQVFQFGEQQEGQCSLYREFWYGNHIDVEGLQIFEAVHFSLWCTKSGKAYALKKLAGRLRPDVATGHAHPQTLQIRGAEYQQGEQCILGKKPAPEELMTTKLEFVNQHFYCPLEMLASLAYQPWHQQLQHRFFQVFCIFELRIVAYWRTFNVGTCPLAEVDDVQGKMGMLVDRL
jgi:hypothetical protein